MNKFIIALAFFSSASASSDSCTGCVDSSGIPWACAGSDGNCYPLCGLDGLCYDIEGGKGVPSMKNVAFASKAKIAKVEDSCTGCVDSSGIPWACAGSDGNCYPLCGLDGLCYDIGSHKGVEAVKKVEKKVEDSCTGCVDSSGIPWACAGSDGNCYPLCGLDGLCYDIESDIGKEKKGVANMPNYELIKSKNAVDRKGNKHLLSVVKSTNPVHSLNRTESCGLPCLSDADCVSDSCTTCEWDFLCGVGSEKKEKMRSKAEKYLKEFPSKDRTESCGLPCLSSADCVSDSCTTCEWDFLCGV
jgi:hypothetical protein